MRIAGKATKGKGKRWMKGGSSDSNPTTNKFRLLAKSGSLTTSAQTSQSRQSFRLDEDVLNQHNLRQLQKLRLEVPKDDRSAPNPDQAVDDDDHESVGGQTFVSVWSNCSNISFNKLLYGFDSSSAIHKQMLAVLAAVTETIKSNGGQESETEYFAILMTCLESADNDETLTAILTLIQMVIKRLPQSVIKLKFSETSKVFVDYLAKYVKGENGLIVRSLISSISVLLEHQEYAVWELSSTKHIFEIILSLTVHNKPRIRKCAQRSVARILKCNTNQSKSSLCHPIAKLTGDFCVRKLEDNSSDNLNTMLYVLTLLTDILSVLPNSCLKKCCESILTQMTFGNVLIVSTAFKAFYILFVSQPHQEILTADLNAKLISALYDYQPNINDSQPLCAWIQAIKQGFLNLNRIDKKLSYNHLPKLFNISIDCLLSDSKEVHLCIASNLKQIYSDCIELSAQEIDKQIIERVYLSFEKALQYEYFNAYSLIFELISHYLNKDFAGFTTNIIIKMVAIRDSYDCAYSSQIDRTIGRVCLVFGPKYIIQLCPMDLNDDNTDICHNWLLPILRDNIRNTEISLFIDYFYPIIISLHKTCKTLEMDGNLMTSKTCSILLSQIWSLLPSFFNKPTDFEISFKKFAPILGDSLSKMPAIRSYILSAFRNLSKNFDNELVLKELNRFSKNFLPILFNIYTNEQISNDEKNQRFSVYEIIQIFFSISDNSLIINLYLKLSEKLQNCENNTFLKHSLMDLIRAFVPYVRDEDIKQIYNQLVVMYLKDNKLITEQKKAFRILEEICKNEVNVCRNFVSNNLNDLLNVLNESLSKCLSSSKAFVLKAITQLIESNISNDTIDWQKILLEILPKVLNCLTINSVKVKTASFGLISCIANSCKTLNNGNVDEFIKIMLLYLDKNDYSSTVVVQCLTRLYDEFRSEIPKHIECDIIETIISKLDSENRQTIQAAIDFVKYFFKVSSADQLSAYLELLVTRLSNINRKHKNHFRIKVKEMFIRLVRRYGYEMISKMIPEEYKKVIKNIRKLEDRKRKMSVKASEDGSDEKTIKTSKSKRTNREFEDIIADSSDEVSEDDDQMTTVSRKSKSWIKEETNDNEIVDLLSNKLSQNIIHKDPNIKPKEKSQAFEMTSDGKIIIKDLDNPKRGVKRQLGDECDVNDNDDDIDDIISNKQSMKSVSTKKSEYTAGGKGIHRPIARQLGEEYKSNKAKGDMKRKGKPDPFAYIPLDRQVLNKRKTAKMSGHFKNLVNAARKGAKIGSNKRAKKLRKS
ncbi:RRP12-like protein [Oppia nitens]|uniref:RRP12-like protein n=1 Tax=Oppia nitens TaxID=1686743 RepID=UPI0023DA74CB|nr:RRP12-like protein [Oppia nitens]